MLKDRFLLAFCILCIMSKVNLLVSLSQENTDSIASKIGLSVVKVLSYDDKGKILAQGSGFFIMAMENGYVITLGKLVKGYNRTEIQTYDGQTYPIVRVMDSFENMLILSVDIPSEAVHPMTIQVIDLFITPEFHEPVLVIGPYSDSKPWYVVDNESDIQEIWKVGKILRIAELISDNCDGCPIVNMRGQLLGLVNSETIDGQKSVFAISGIKTVGFIAAFLIKERNDPFIMPQIYDHTLPLDEVEIHKVTTEASRKRKSDSDEILQLYLKGISFEKNKQKGKAIASYKAAIDKGATLVGVFLNLALIHKADGNLPDAIIVLQEGINRNEAINTPKSDLAQLYNNLGNVYTLQEKYQKSIENLEKALSLDDNLQGINLNIGICYDVWLEQREKAIPYYLKEIEIAPNSKYTFDAYLNLGIIFQEIYDDYDKSIEYLRDAIRVGPDDFDRYKAYHAIANCYYFKGDLINAKKNWKKVIEIAPNTDLGEVAKHNISAIDKKY